MADGKMGLFGDQWPGVALPVAGIVFCDIDAYAFAPKARFTDTSAGG